MQLVWSSVQKTFLLPWMEQNFGLDNVVLIQDSPPSHTSIATQAFLGEKAPFFVRAKIWPSNSPDLNLLDYFFGACFKQWPMLHNTQTSRAWRHAKSKGQRLTVAKQFCSYVEAWSYWVMNACVLIHIRFKLYWCTTITLVNILLPSISFQTFFVQAFKIVVDSWKSSMLLLYVLWDDWQIFMISGSNEQLQQQLEYTLLKPDCHILWISKIQSGREDTLEEWYAIKFCFCISFGVA